MLNLLTFIMVSLMFLPFALDKAATAVKFIKAQAAKLGL